MTDETPGLELTRTITRSISIPVAECLSCSWRDFNRLLHASWRHSTDLANWARHTLTRLDVTRTPGMKELPPMRPVDLYALAFGRRQERPARKAGNAPLPIVPQEYDAAAFWGGAKVTAATLLRAVLHKYSAERGKVIWRRERRSVEYQYPHPFPVHQRAWVASFNERGQALVNLGLPGGRVMVRLRGGAEFARQLQILRMIVDGTVKQQELKLCRQRTHTSDGAGHYRADSERVNGGAERISYRIMLRISCQIPVCQENPSEVSATVRTGSMPFITLVIADQEPWLLHVRQVLGWMVAHRRFLDSMAVDLKYKKRWPRHQRRRMLGRLKRGCVKHSRRMKTFCQQTAAAIAGHAQRRGCGALVWDDSDRSFASRDFPWFQLREDVKNKCDELGLRFALAASGDAPETDAAENSDGSGE
jgi:hypothetical protein